MISTPFATFYTRKGRIFKLLEEKRSLWENTCQVSFIRIPYSPPFGIVVHSSLLCLSVICWPHVCCRELIFNPMISLSLFKSLILCFLFLISLVSYQNNFIYFQGHCFNIWSLFLSLPCSKHKGRIFRFPVVKRSLLGISSWTSFLRILDSLKFCIVLHIYLLCFRVIRLLYACTRKLFLNPLISLFVFYSDVALSIPHFFSFVST